MDIPTRIQKKTLILLKVTFVNLQTFCACISQAALCPDSKRQFIQENFKHYLKEIYKYVCYIFISVCRLMHIIH